MTNIDRRALLTRGAIGGAALTLTSGAALASVGEDAELRQLWSEYQRQLPIVKAAIGPRQRAYKRVWTHMGKLPRWRLFDVYYGVWQGEKTWIATSRDIAIDGKGEQRLVPLPTAKSEESAKRQAAAMDKAADAEWEKEFEYVSQKHNRNALYDRWVQESDKVQAIAKVMTATPAKGITGFRIKAAVIESLDRLGDDYEVDSEDLLESLFDDLRAGVDLAAEVERW